ncbi:site-2 protease family protein [Streptomyces sp. NPDC058469]|uniref:site-2 protease family protein n=1 Tax=Streptomyces sp. NPDC058469 TaxID=3346514 RepID=UPI0036659A90
MDESGGSGQPRSGTNEPTEHATGATTPAAAPGTPEPKPDDSAHGKPETSAQEHGDAKASSGEHESATEPPEDRTDATAPSEERRATGTSSEDPKDASTTSQDRGGSTSPGEHRAAGASSQDPGDANTSSGEHEGVSALSETREHATSSSEAREESSTSLEHTTRDGDLEPGTSSGPAAEGRTEPESPSGSAENGAAETETPPDSSGPTTHHRAETEETSGATAHSRTNTEGTSAPTTNQRTAPEATDTSSGPAAQDHSEPGTSPAPSPPSRLNGEPKRDGTSTGNDHGADNTDDHDHTPSHPNLPYAHTDPNAAPHADPRIAKGRPPQRPKEPGGGLLMGRPFGVPVYVAPSWFLVAALITWVFGGQLGRVLPELGAARYLVALFFAVAFYGSVLVHELAHTVAALRFKLPVRRIQLQFFGGVSEIEKEAETPGREFVLAFVGPLLSLILSGIFYVAMLPVEPGTVPGVLLAGLMVSNLIVAAFNLLPGLPLDGGRMLRAVVWKITGRPMSGTIAAAWVGRALAVSVLIGLPLLTQTGALGTNTEDISGMDTVTDALLAAILAAIIWTGAGNSLRMARLREHLPELRARNLTRRAVPVETNTPLSEALRRANAAGARALVVVDADGQPLSLVREAAIVGVPEHRRPWVVVSGLAQDLTDGMRVSVELAGEDLLDALRATPATEYLVVEETGEIYGVLSAADVERAFVKAMARPN